SPSASFVSQLLGEIRNSYRDLDQTWSYPLKTTPQYPNYPLHGTFGEWRGGPNDHVHIGIDLRAPSVTTVLASRGGLVTFRGTMGCIGNYVIIDHGDGFFSAYLHLDAGSIAVMKGQKVPRGYPIASRLYSQASGCKAWGEHLHFEIRYDASLRFHFGEGYTHDNPEFPAQDPLQTLNIFPVPQGVLPPQVEEI